MYTNIHTVGMIQTQCLYVVCHELFVHWNWIYFEYLILLNIKHVSAFSGAVHVTKHIMGMFCPSLTPSR
jgi:hypothetical protein